VTRVGARLPPSLPPSLSLSLLPPPPFPSRTGIRSHFHAHSESHGERERERERGRGREGERNYPSLSQVQDHGLASGTREEASLAHGKTSDVVGVARELQDGVEQLDALFVVAAPNIRSSSSTAQIGLPLSSPRRVAAMWSRITDLGSPLRWRDSAGGEAIQAGSQSVRSAQAAGGNPNSSREHLNLCCICVRHHSEWNPLRGPSTSTESASEQD
jgi:hypothetical protein